MLRLALILVLGSLAACWMTTRTTTHSSHGGDLVLVRAQPTELWRVVEAGELVGYVIRFDEDPSDEETSTRTFFSVRNPSHQELGMIDQQGRFYRYQPHQRNPEWIGSGSVSRGARKILGLSNAAELVRSRLEESPVTPPGG